MITLTAKVRIYVTEDKVGILEETMQAYCSACNWLSAQIFETKKLNQLELNNLFYSKLRYLFKLKSQMAQSVIRTVVAKYKSVRSNGHEWSLIEFKKLEYDLVWNRDYSLNGNQFSVNTLGGRQKLSYERKVIKKYFDGSWKFGTAKLVCKNNKWYLYIPMSKKVNEVELLGVKNIVGIDLGINFLATSYDSQGDTVFFNGRKVKHRRGQFIGLRKQLQIRKTQSARKALKKVGSRENRYVRDINHKITKALVEQHPKGTLFVLEDLSNIRRVTKKVRTCNRYISVSWAFYQFRQMLEYKATLHGQKVIVVDPAYTSQTCPICRHVDKRNRNKKLHHFKCLQCDYQSNDDRVGAMNLHRKGIEYIEAVME